eukprot:403339101
MKNLNVEFHQQMPLIKRAVHSQKSSNINNSSSQYNTDDSLMILNYPGVLPNQYLQQQDKVTAPTFQTNDVSFDTDQHKKEQIQEQMNSRNSQMIQNNMNEHDEPKMPVFNEQQEQNGPSQILYMDNNNITNNSHSTQRYNKSSPIKQQKIGQLSDIRAIQFARESNMVFTKLNTNSQRYVDHYILKDSVNINKNYNDSNYNTDGAAFLNNLNNLKLIYRQQPIEYIDQIQGEYMKQSSVRKSQIKSIDNQGDIPSNGSQLEKPPRPNIHGNAPGQRGVQSFSIKLKDHQPILAQSSKKHKIVKTEDSFYFPQQVKTNEGNRSFKDEAAVKNKNTSASLYQERNQPNQREQPISDQLPIRGHSQIKKTLEETKNLVNQLNRQATSYNKSKHQSVKRNTNKDFDSDLIILQDDQLQQQQQSTLKANLKHRKLDKIKTNQNSQSTSNLKDLIDQKSKIKDQTLSKGDESSQSKKIRLYQTIEDQKQTFTDISILAANYKNQSQANFQTQKGTPHKTNTENLAKQIQKDSSTHSQNFYQTAYNKSNLQEKLQKEKNQQLDIFLKVQNAQQKLNQREIAKKDREMIRTFMKRHGYEGDDKIVFLFNSRDLFLKRTAIKRGWFENPIMNSHFFDVKWDYIDNQGEFNNLKPNQFYNHFPDGREITTKQGLNKNINNLSEYGIDIYKFYPRCYDFSDLKQIDMFVEDFNKTAILNIVKRHAKHFKSIFKTKLQEIYKQDQGILDNIFKHQNKRDLKRQSMSILHNQEEQTKLGTVNLVLLQNAIFYAYNMIRDLSESCEGDEFIKKDFYKDRYEFQAKIVELMLQYSQLTLPITDISLVNKDLQKLTGWDYPNMYIIFVTYKIHKLLKQCLSQYDMIDDSYNTWICKPSYNARGFGIFCFNSLNQLFNGQTRKQTAPKIVQKYIEKSLLIKGLNPQNPEDHRKFDLRQWVFVSSYEPMKIYVYKQAYLRVCGSQFDLSDISDPFKHISNYSIQKNKQDSVVTDLVMSCDEFIEYLEQQNIQIDGKKITWDYFLRQIEQIVKNTFQSINEFAENKPNCFELYGFDFVIDKKLNCWLIEANMSPACAERTPWLTEMLDDMADGLLSIIEKKVILANEFNGPLSKIAEQYKQKQISLIQNHGKNLTSQISLEIKKKKQQNPSPSKNQKKQNQPLPFNSNTKSFNFELISYKANLKLEKKIDKRFKMLCAALFIQKCWRGYNVRRQIFLEKMRTTIKESRKKKSIKILQDVLQQVFTRVKELDIVNSGFEILKRSYLLQSIKKDESKLQKLIKLQIFIKQFQRRKQLITFMSQSETINELNVEYLQLTFESIKNTIIFSKVEDELFEIDQKRKEIAKFRGSMNPSKAHYGTLDPELLLDYQAIGLTINQQENQTIAQKQEHMNKKLSAKNSPKQSPYLANMKVTTTNAFKKKPNKITAKKVVKDPIQCLNMTLLKTQRQKLDFGSEMVSGEEEIVKNELIC